MRVTEKRTVENEYLKEIKCDICGKSNGGGMTWDKKHYDVDETYLSVKTEIRHKDGTLYPDYGDGSEYEVDICPQCFKEKLIPWLESQGVKRERVEWSW